MDLLNSIVYAQISNEYHAETDLWLNRLVQRFEVSKKIFTLYPPGFIKGEGTTNNIRVYWQLAMALYLQYDSTSNFQFISTALKTIDLICSLPASIISLEITNREMEMLLCEENRLVKELIQGKIHEFSP